MASQMMVCRNCGNSGIPKTFTKGSLTTEIVLWVFCAMVPGLIYSIWRVMTKYKGCATCGSSDLVPPESPRGRELLKEYANK